MSTYSFPKQERLKSRKQIQLLFQRGKSVSKYPIKLIYSLSPISDLDKNSQFAFSVPKKRMPKAVKRNLLKRRMREVHRLNKSHLLETLLDKNQCIKAMLIYNSNEILSFDIILESYLEILHKLSSRV